MGRKLLVLALVFGLLLSLLPAPRTAGSPTTTPWAKTYGGSDEDEAYAVALAPNGDIIVVGSTDSFGAGRSDVWVLRLDDNGNVKWQKTYGGYDEDGAYAVTIAPNGDIVVVGYTYSFGDGLADVWVMRLDGEGNIKWQKAYGGSDDDKATAVSLAENGDIIVAGWTKSFRTGPSDYSEIWVLRLDKNGNVKWQKTYGESDWQGAYGIALEDNGDIIVAGSLDTGDGDVWVLRLDGNGNVKWQKAYGGSDEDMVNGVTLTPDGDIIVAGYTESFNADGRDLWVLRLDSNGNVKWQKTYGGNNDDEAHAVAVAKNGDVIVVGKTQSFGAGSSAFWVLRLDKKGNVKWQRTYGGSDDDEAYAVAIARNGDIIVAGETESFGDNGGDVWVLRLDSDGDLRAGLMGISHANVSETDAFPSDTSASVAQTNAFVEDTDAIVMTSSAHAEDLIPSGVRLPNCANRIYGGNKKEVAFSVTSTPNGDIILAGKTDSFGAGRSDVWVLRLDDNGNVKWQKTYGGSDEDEAHAVAVAPNGDIIVAGVYGAVWNSEKHIWEKGDVWVLRLDSNGNVKWQKTYGGKNWDWVSRIALADNGDIIIVGQTNSSGAGNRDAWVLRLDKNGNIKWQKTYGGHELDGFADVALAENGDIIVVGWTASFGAGSWDTWVLRLDADGNVKWQKTYGGKSWEFAVAAALTGDGDIVVAGGTASFGAGDADFWVLRLDENGNIKWQKTYGGGEGDGFWDSDLVIAPNGDIIVAGVTESFGAGDWDAWVLRLDKNGNIKWQKTYGGKGDDSIEALTLFPNGDIVAAGWTSSFGSGGDDVWLLRLDANGRPEIDLPWLKYGISSNATVSTSNASVEETNAEVSMSEAVAKDSNAIVKPSNAEGIPLLPCKSSNKPFLGGSLGNSPSGPGKTPTTTKGKRGICGPAAIIGLATTPLLLRRRKPSEFLPL